MKKLAVTILVLFLCSNVAFCVPAKDYKGTEPIIYDASYNIELFNRLDKAFDKKYIVEKSSNRTVYNYPLGAYGREVLAPYYEQYKSDEVLIKEELAKRNK